MKRKRKGFEAIKVKMYMVRDNITQEALAKKLGIGLQTLNFKLNGKRVWTLDEAMQLARIFRTTLDDLFCASELTNGNPILPNSKKKVAGEN